MKSVHNIWLGSLIIVLLAPTLAFGYANDGDLGGPHRMINQFALQMFVEMAQKDPILSRYDFQPTVEKYGLPALSVNEAKVFTVEYDSVTRSGPWAREDKITSFGGFQTYDGDSYYEEGKRRNPFAWWIVEGGYSADEPEAYMALRHFYDPKDQAAPYLTDLIGKPVNTPVVPGGVVGDALSLAVEVTMAATQGGQHITIMGENPQVNARDWAQFGSKHSLQDVTKSMAYALGPASKGAVPEDKEELFGRAWRSIGESMHLLADMTVPAHVRNDGHPGSKWYTKPAAEFSAQYDLKSDPYEDFVTARIVQNHAGGMLDEETRKKIAGTSNARDLFDMIATYTNEHFFSEDTVSGKDVHGDQITSYNGQSDYAAPKLDQLEFDGGEADATGYYYRNDGAGQVKMLARIYEDGLLRKTEKLLIDDQVSDSQASRLIPVTIAANARLMELAIPRVGVVIDELDGKNKVLKCHVVHYALGQNGQYDPKAPVLSDGMPTTRARAIVRLSAGGETRHFWQEIKGLSAGSFEVSLENIPSIKLDQFMNYDPNDPPAAEIKLAVGLDMGGIAVWSEDLVPKAISISPAEVEMDVDASLSFRIDAVGMKNKAVVWSIREKNGGQITQDGAYRSPGTPGTFHIEAALQSDPSVKAVALVRVLIKAAAAVLPKQQRDDRTWNTLINDICLLDNANVPEGTLRHGFKYYGTGMNSTCEAGKPCLEGWNKIVETGTYTRYGQDGKMETHPFWIGYRVDTRESSDAIGTYMTPHPPGTPWEKAKEGILWMREYGKLENITELVIGDLAVVGTTQPGYATETLGARCRAWRGPFSISAGVYAFLVQQEGDTRYTNPRTSLYQGMTRSDIPQEMIDRTLKNLPQVAVEVVTQIMAEFDSWYFNRVAEGPGVKGLYYPLERDRYSLKNEDLPDGLRVDTELGWRMHKIVQPGTEDVYFVYWYVEEISSDDKTFAMPVTRAHDKLRLKLKEKTSSIHAEPRDVQLAGADEAVELCSSPKNDPSNGRHELLFRKANVWVEIDARYKSGAFAAQSPYAHKLAMIMLDKMNKDKPGQSPVVAAQPKVVAQEAPVSVQPLAQPVAKPVEKQVLQEQPSAQPAATPVDKDAEEIRKSVEDIKKSAEELKNSFKSLGSLFK